MKAVKISWWIERFEPKEILLPSTMKDVFEIEGIHQHKTFYRGLEVWLYACI